MTSLGNPLLPQILARLDAFIRQMDFNPGKPRPPTSLEIAHSRNADLAKLDALCCSDIGMSAPDATGISSYQPDLPFFMQSGFKS